MRRANSSSTSPPALARRAIGDRLVAAGVIRDRLTYRAALWLTGEARHLQAGEYRFDRPLTPVEVVGKIARGEVHVVPITFPEGLTIPEMAAIFQSHGLGTAASFAAAARDGSIVSDLDPIAKDLEGYLFPSTYNVPRKTDRRPTRPIDGREIQDRTDSLTCEAPRRIATSRSGSS